MRADGAVPPGAGSLKIRKRKARDTVITEWLFIWPKPAASKTKHPLSTMTLGKYSEQPRPGHLTIDEARQLAIKLQQQVRAGEDPRSHR